MFHMTTACNTAVEDAWGHILYFMSQQGLVLVKPEEGRERIVSALATVIWQNTQHNPAAAVDQCPLRQQEKRITAYYTAKETDNVQPV